MQFPAPTGLPRWCAPHPGRPSRGCSAIAGVRVVGAEPPLEVGERPLQQGDRLGRAARILVGHREVVPRCQVPARHHPREACQASSRPTGRQLTTGARMVASILWRPSRSLCSTKTTASPAIPDGRRIRVLEFPEPACLAGGGGADYSRAALAPPGAGPRRGPGRFRSPLLSGLPGDITFVHGEGG
jgi:hypothetical protein